MRARVIMAVVVCAGWAGALLCAPPAPAAERARWMREARWGLMTHYLADWIWRGESEQVGADTLPADFRELRRRRAEQYSLLATSENWNKLVDGFDVEGLAKQLADAKVPYYLFTIGQNSGFYVAPNRTYDEIVGITPSKCARRDLISDLADALGKRGIRLMVYLPTGAPAGDAVAIRALEWQNGPYPNRAFCAKWERVVRDWSLRFGRKVSGWWFDGAYWPNAMYRSLEAPNYASLAAAARAGNPDAAVAICPGPIQPMLSVSPEEDYTAGEVGSPADFFLRYWPPRIVGGKVDGAQLQMLSRLGPTWGFGPARESPEQVVAWTRKINAEGGAATWDVAVQRNGLISEELMQTVRALGVAAQQPLPAPGRPADASAQASPRAAEPPARASVPLPSASPSSSAGRTERAAWLKAARWGLFARYQPMRAGSGAGGPRRGGEGGEAPRSPAGTWNDRVAGFDVEGLGRQLEAIGAPYVMISVSYGSGFYLAPNDTYDALVGTPGKCSQRDLVGDLADACARRGIRLMVHVPGGAPPGEAAVLKALEWQDGPSPNRAFCAKWERVVRDWSQRWGKKVAGWYFDGCYWPNAMYRSPEPPNFGSLAAAARTGNPEAIVAFNPGGRVNRVFSVTPYEDFIAGESPFVMDVFPEFRRVQDGSVDGAQLHLLGRFLLQEPEQIVAWTRRLNRASGTFTWEVGLQEDGLLAAQTLAALEWIGAELQKPAAPVPPPRSQRPGD